MATFLPAAAIAADAAPVRPVRLALDKVMTAVVLMEPFAGHKVLAAPVAAAPAMLPADAVLACVIALAGMVALASVVATAVAAVATVAGAPTSLACTSEEHAILTR